MNAQPLQRSDDWQAQRTGRITGSRVGAILGLSKYRTRDDVLREMVRQHFGAPPEFAGNAATEYGQAHEADAIDAYEQRFGTLVEPSGLVVHPDYDWLAASPDGLVGDDGMIEAKCPMRARYTEPSDEYQAQMQLQMACTGRAWCDFVVWRDGEPLAVTRIARDTHWLANALPVLRAFIDEFHEICADESKAAPYLADKVRDDAEWRDAVDEYICAARDAKAAKAREDAARSRLVGMAPQGAKGCGLQLIRVERAGAIRYADALKSMLPDVDLSPWRGKPSISYTIKESK